ncbi:MAG TPA: RHS repeat-associated core domain-containing protein [Thermoanaerobaculia bacterium]|nr:RHS repeat-associated core domain-containing protein [Thermoanaerobaculia bacterium]
MLDFGGSSSGLSRSAVAFAAALLLLLPSSSPAQSLPGDASADGVVDAADLPAIRDVILERGTAPGDPDCTRDGAVDVRDLVCVTAIAALPLPVVTGLEPSAVRAGQSVTLTGTGLASPLGLPPRVELSRQGGGALDAPVTAADAVSIVLTVPAGAASGPVRVTVPGRPAVTSAASLLVLPTSAFSLEVMPPSLAIQVGQRGSLVVRLTSADGFNRLAELSLSGLPAGITAGFSPARITAGQSALLTLTVPAGAAPASWPLAVAASATVDGVALADSVPVTLTVEPLTTSFLGRTVVADPLQTPLAGVVVSMLGRDGQGNATGCAGQTVTDAAGNFALTNLPAECVGPQLIRWDGRTATAPPGQYAGLDVVFTLTAGQATVSPVLVHLPRIDGSETFFVEQNAPFDQTHVFETIPNLSVTVYAGTVFTLLDGSQPDPFPLIGVQVPIDRLPDDMPPPPGQVTPFIVAFQPANATASQPVAVWFPNLLATPPGTQMPLITLDPTLGLMVPYGTGTISADGRQVVPDPDPARPGHRYGLVHFDWHGPVPPPPPPGTGCKTPCCLAAGAPGSAGAGGGLGGNPSAGKPVDLSSGIEVLRATDLALRGPRGAIEIARTYRTRWGEAGPFGIGTGHSYGWRLDTPQPQTALLINLITPEGNRFPFRRQPDDTFVSEAIPALAGARMTLAGGAVELRFKDGGIYRFVSTGSLLLGSLLESITDRNGGAVTLVRDGARPLRILEIVDPVGRKLLLNWDSSDRVTGVTDPIGRTVAYAYNAQGTLAEVTDPAGGLTRYEYDGANRLLRVIDPRGVVVAENAYDGAGRVAQQTAGDGGVTQFSYQLLNPNDPSGPLLGTIVTDPLGRVSRYRFSSEQLLLGATDPTGQTRVFTLEPGSNLLASVTGNAACSTCGVPAAGARSFSWDERGNVTGETDAVGATTTYTYLPDLALPTSRTDALGGVATFSYDAAGNLLSATAEDGKVSSYTYDANGQLLEARDPLGRTTRHAYDAWGNLVEVVDALGRTSRLGYDAVYRLAEVIDPQGRARRFDYDPLDRLVAVTDARGGVTRFSWDGAGNLLSVTDARGKVTSFAWDGANRLIRRTDPLGREEHLSYDLAGNLIATTNRRGQIRQLVYDERDRLVAELEPDGARTDYDYDAEGRLVAVRDTVAGDHLLAWDPAGRQVRLVSPVGTVETSYDLLGRVSRRQVVGLAPVDYGYDPAGRLTSVAAGSLAASFGYDNAGRLAATLRSNGVRSDYTLDPLGRVLALVHANAGGALASLAYEIDALGRPTSTTGEHLGPLATPASVSSYDDANRLLSSGTETFTWDEDGHLLSRQGVAGTTTFGWDARGRLRSISAPGAAPVELTYDFTGNLLKRRQGGVTRGYLFDPLGNLLATADTAAGTTRVIAGRGLDATLALERPDGTLELPLSDPAGSTIATLDATGALVARHGYEPFGQASPLGSGFELGFLGRFEVAPGLVQLGARVYDPGLGRFLSEDPLGFDGGDPNLYRYAANSPTTLSDPRGRAVVETSSTASVGLGGRSQLGGSLVVDPTNGLIGLKVCGGVGVVKGGGLFINVGNVTVSPGSLSPGWSGDVSLVGHAQAAFGSGGGVSGSLGLSGPIGGGCGGGQPSVQATPSAGTTYGIGAEAGVSVVGCVTYVF